MEYHMFNLFLTSWGLLALATFTKIMMGVYK
jgi:hypothetical protein